MCQKDVKWDFELWIGMDDKILVDQETFMSNFLMWKGSELVVFLLSLMHCIQHCWASGGLFWCSEQATDLFWKT